MLIYFKIIIIIIIIIIIVIIIFIILTIAILLSLLPNNNKNNNNNNNNNFLIQTMRSVTNKTKLIKSLTTNLNIMRINDRPAQVNCYISSS